jgi:hypothetical protein
MGKYQATPGGKTLGASIHSTVESLGPFKETGYRLLAQVGISEIKDQEWYPQQTYCDFLELIQQKVGNSTLYIAGRNQGLEAVLPPQLDSPEKVLAGFSQVYRLAHQGVPATEGWTFTPTGPNSATMTCTSPYPDEFSRGVCDGFVRRFNAGSASAKIDETKPRVDNGGKSVTILVRW